MLLLAVGGGVEEVQPYKEGYFVEMDGNNRNGGHVLPNNNNNNNDNEKVYSDKQLDVEVPVTAHQISQGLFFLHDSDFLESLGIVFFFLVSMVRLVCIIRVLFGLCFLNLFCIGYIWNGCCILSFTSIGFVVFSSLIEDINIITT